MKTLGLYLITGLAILISFVASRDKTVKALKIAFRQFVNIFPTFFTMIILISIVLFVFPDNVLLKYLGGGSKMRSVLIASFLGSITVAPGFIAFPLCGILLKKGVAYMVLSLLLALL